MNMRVALCATVATLAGAGAAAQPASPTASAAPSEAAPSQSCNGRKFETTVRVTVDGKGRQSNVKLCGKEGQTDTQWAATLRDAASKIQANEKMAPEARAQVVTAIEAELAKLEAAAAKAARTTTLTLPRETANRGVAPPTARATGLPEYSTLPPLPDPTVARPATPVAASAVPISTVAGTGIGARPALPAIPPPRVTVSCLLPSDYGAAGPCSTIETETRLTIRADENLPSGLRLRFLRRGSERGEVALAAMTQGQTLRVRPPAKLCQGVTRSRAEIEIMRPGTESGAQAVEKLGPYELRC